MQMLGGTSNGFQFPRESRACWLSDRPGTLNLTADGQNLVNQLGRFKSVVTVVHAVAEEILHHLGCIVNNGINYLSTGAGFLPSSVGCFLHQHIELVSRIPANQHMKGTMSIDI